MARQNTTKSTKATKAEAPTEENVVTENATETVEATEAIDLTGFSAAVATALTQGDKTTGELPASAVELVNVEYRKLDGTAAKKAARDSLDAGMLQAVNDLDAATARGYSDLRSQLKAGGGTKSTKAPSDPTDAFVQRLVAHRIAYGLVAVPGEGVAEDYTERADALATDLAEQVAAYKAWVESESEDKGDAPEVSPVVRQAFKLASGKASGSRGGSTGGPRRDIAKHIQSAFADKAPGEFLSVADIAKHKSEEYGEASPSQGAISARLFPTSGKSTVEGVTSVDKTETNPKGAVKA